MNVAICDVTARDGFQNEDKVLPPRVRAEAVDRIVATGVRRAEVASFVHPARVPAMAGAEDVVAALSRDADVVHSALVLNRRGYDRFVGCELPEVHFAFASTDTFNLRNAGKPADDSADEIAAILVDARAAGLQTAVTIGASFGCPFEGYVDPGRVYAYAERFQAAGADQVYFADTIGVAVPRQIRALVQPAAAAGMTVGLHLHNTRNTGYANAVAGIEAGVAILDATTGGLGGCPFSPRATGNIATEDLVYLLEGQGLDTGVDLDELIRVSQWLSTVMGKVLDGQLAKAGDFPDVSRRHRPAPGAGDP